MTEELALINRYRPSDFEEVIGHGPVLKALQRAMGRTDRPKSYLFSGPGGTGKTTLARIVAAQLHADVIDVDAASESGVDEMRALKELGQHLALTANGKRMFIIDECHALSKGAWTALLKITEEPPPHLFFAFCTTELRKVPDTIVQRCFHCDLRPVGPAELETLLSAVIEAEGWEVLDTVVSAVIEAADGSPRKALSLLEKAHDAEDPDDIRRLLSTVRKGEPVYDLCQSIMKGAQWPEVQKNVNRIQDGEFDAALVQIGGYLASVMQKAKKPEQAQRAWRMLDALLFPAQSYHPKALLYAAIGRVLWGASE